MAGWYLVLILMNGHVTVNQSPMSEEGCRQQLQLTTVTGLKAACVEVK